MIRWYLFFRSLVLKLESRKVVQSTSFVPCLTWIRRWPSVPELRYQNSRIGAKFCTSFRIHLPRMSPQLKWSKLNCSNLWDRIDALEKRERKKKCRLFVPFLRCLWDLKTTSVIVSDNFSSWIDNSEIEVDNFRQSKLSIDWWQILCDTDSEKIKGPIKVRIALGCESDPY
jgi:hypothetical protein